MTPKQIPFTWPIDADGNPQALITSTVRELIPTAKFANVEISNTVTKFVPDENLSDHLSDAYDEADKALQVKRDLILEDLDSGNK